MLFMSIVSRGLAASLACALIAPLTAAHAQTAAPATFLVVHGIPGRDIAPTLDPVLPVDVLVAGKYCLLQGLTFGTIAGPFQVPAGTYPVAISLANPIAPCSNSAVISANVTLSAGEVGAVVAAVSTKGAPTAEVYPLNLASVGAGKQRFMVAHAADAPPVRVTAVSTSGGSVEKTGFGLLPGKEDSVTVPARGSFELLAKTGSGAVIGPVSVTVGNQAVTAVFAVGSATTGSAQLLTKVIPDVE
jgi:hypothetical protein